MSMNHVIHEVDITEVIRSSGIISRLSRLRVHRDHEFFPSSYLTHGHDNFVNVQECDVLVLVEIPV